MYVSFSYCLTDGLNLQKIKKGTPKISKYLLVLVLTTMYTFYLIYLLLFYTNLHIFMRVVNIWLLNIRLNIRQEKRILMSIFWLKKATSCSETNFSKSNKKLSPTPACVSKSYSEWNFCRKTKLNDFLWIKIALSRCTIS